MVSSTLKTGLRRRRPRVALTGVQLDIFPELSAFYPQNKNIFHRLLRTPHLPWLKLLLIYFSAFHKYFEFEAFIWAPDSPGHTNFINLHLDRIVRITILSSFIMTHAKIFRPIKFCQLKLFHAIFFPEVEWWVKQSSRGADVNLDHIAFKVKMGKEPKRSQRQSERKVWQALVSLDIAIRRHGEQSVIVVISFAGHIKICIIFQISGFASKRESVCVGFEISWALICILLGIFYVE